MTALQVPDDSLALPSLAKGTTFTDWAAIGEQLTLRARNLSWLIGDWWVFGRKHFAVGKTEDERHAHLVERLKTHGYAGNVPALQTAKNCARVCGAIDPDRRRDDLTFGHHDAVASLPPKQQDKWLADAMTGEHGRRWSVATLRQKLREAKGEDREPPPATQPKTETVKFSVEATLAFIRGMDDVAALKRLAREIDARLDTLCDKPDTQPYKVADVTPAAFDDGKAELTGFITWLDKNAPGGYRVTQTIATERVDPDLADLHQFEGKEGTVYEVSEEKYLWVAGSTRLPAVLH